MTGPSQGTCPLCRGQDARTLREFDTDDLLVDCVRCGRFGITKGAEELAGSTAFESKRYILSGLARNGSSSAERFLFTAANLQRLIDGAPVPRTIFDAADRMMQHLGAKVGDFGGEIKVDRNDYPIVFARTADEYSRILTHLLERNFLRGGEFSKYSLTVEGWRHLESQRRRSARSTQAFVAMWFNKELEAAWLEGFRPALEQNGLNAIRMDELQHNDKICDRIIAEIRGSALVVADFTGQRGDVYFEAGYALALGIPVIWTCRQDDLANVHFDTRQYNHIAWVEPTMLREALGDRIRATLVAPRVDS